MTRTCTACGAVLPATRDYFFGARPGNLRGDCKACTRARNNANAARNRARKCEYDKAYRAANKERLAAKKAADYAANRDHVLELSRRWKAEHAQRHRTATRMRRARLLGLETSHTSADVRAQYARQRGRCYWCHEKVGDQYHVDHVTPLALGGSNGSENIVVACPRCNLTKQARHPIDFAGVLC